MNLTAKGGCAFFILGLAIVGLIAIVVELSELIL